MSGGRRTDGSDSVTTADPLDDDLPAADYGGYEFRFYTYGSSVDMYASDGENGEVVNDAIYKLNRTVEERFNVKITAIDRCVRGRERRRQA